MPARAFIAALIALALLAGGAYFTLDAKDAGLADVLVLLRRERDAGLLCTIAAWGSLGAGALGVLAAFAAFFEEEDEDGYRRRGFPKAVPVVLIIVSLVLFWAMFDCAAREEAPAQVAISTPAPPVVPAPAPPVVPAPAEPEPPLAAPTIDVAVSAFDWPYMIPLIDDDKPRETPELARALAQIFPRQDDAGRAMLCDAAWVMVSGSASEEGPRPRNETRSRLRAEFAAAAVRSWLAAHTDDCRAPLIVAVDLGQHAPTLPPAAGDGSDTGFERSVIVVSRMRRSADETMTPIEALREAERFLGDPDNARRALAGRAYGKAPTVFLPGAEPALD